MLFREFGKYLKSKFVLRLSLFRIFLRIWALFFKRCAQPESHLAISILVTQSPHPRGSKMCCSRSGALAKGVEEASLVVVVVVWLDFAGTESLRFAQTTI